MTKEEKLLESKCIQYVLNYIYRYPKTESELKAKLYQKWFSWFEIEEALSYVKKKWFLDDEKFVHGYVYSELVNKGKPLIVVKQKLYHKWIEKSLSEKVIKECEEDIQKWIYDKIGREIEKYKKKWEEGFDIIQRLMKKWYYLDDIKHVIHAKDQK